jgi:formamidase
MRAGSIQCKETLAMAETLIKVDLKQSAYENEQVHNRWHPDIPMACWVKPGDDFILETYDWTGGFIKNNDSADDVRDIDLSIVHFLSGPVGVHGAEPGDLLVVDLLDIGTKADSQWGFNGFFSKQNGGGTRSGSVLMKSISRSFHVFSSFGSGRQPIRPG